MGRLAWLFTLLCLLGGGILPAAHAGTVSQMRDFKGLIRQEHAFVAASVAARVQALRDAEKALAAHPDLQFISQKSGANPLLLPDLKGLALRLSTVTLGGHGVGGFPPNMKVAVEMDWTLVEPFREQLLVALEDPEYTALFSLALLRLETLLAAYDRAAPKATMVTPQSLSGQERVLEAQRLVRAMQGTEKYILLLEELQTVWKNPEQILPSIREARKLDPENPLLMVAEAEVQLQLDKPAAAQRLSADAAVLLSNFARAYDVQGAALLRQRLPALAVAAFSEAIKLAPQYAPYYLHRAAANLVQEEIGAMCEDFFAACARGDCEGLEWARKSGKCSR